MTAERRVCLGAFAGAHGVRGEAKVKAFTAAENGVARYGPVETEDGARHLTLQFIRVLKPGLALVRSPDIKSPDDAAALAGVRFYARRSSLPPPDADEFYVEDLVGLPARDEMGAALGIIAAVYNFGAGDVIEIKDGKGGATLIPFTKAAVPSVNLAARIVTISAAALAVGDEDAAPAEEMRREND